jgi:hypothetical protein
MLNDIDDEEEDEFDEFEEGYWEDSEEKHENQNLIKI